MYSIIFFGSDEFSVSALKALISNGANVVACVTKPDKARKRNKIIYNPVKKYLLDQGVDIALYQPEKASTDEFVAKMKGYCPDLFVVVSYGEIISELLLAVPKILPVNIHPSLLPKYRGASPLRSALLNGDRKIGVAIIEMVKKMDAGSILYMEEMDVMENEHHSDLEKRVHELSGGLLLKWMKSIEDGDIEKRTQEGEVTFTKKFTTNDRHLDLTQPSSFVLNKIRAFGSSPGAYIYVTIGEKKEQLKIVRAKASLKSEEFTKTSWVIPCEEGCIEVLEVQRENKKVCKVSDFYNGLQGVSPKVERM